MVEGNPWHALVPRIADAVVGKLEERKNIAAVAAEVVLLLEESGRIQRQGCRPAARERATDAIDEREGEEPTQMSPVPRP
ncbi:MAG: hypothetical protein COZ57_35175 [Armatimonadetes bacterium CG_4_8_14_3_um_filter_66_20]|nr:MAG: hypothetical protein COZ57_35175 [Armatimonadetes bacterium CG_4_8_14_3_um_filter_66_20]